MENINPNETPELSDRELEDVSGGMQYVYQDDTQQGSSYNLDNIHQKVNDLISDKFGYKAEPESGNYPAQFNEDSK